MKVSSIPLLGLKVFGGDLGLLSAIAMLVLSVWLYYAFRREQHCVARLIMRVGSIAYAEEGPPVAIVAKYILFFAPFYVVMLALLADVTSLFWPSKLIGGDSLWSAMNSGEQASVVMKTFVCACIIVLIHNVVRRAVYFAVWTQTIYRGLALAVHNAKRDRKEFDIPWADEQEEKVAVQDLNGVVLPH